MATQEQFKLPLHLLQANNHQASLAQNSAVNTNRSDTKTKMVFCGNQSQRTAEHQSSYNTADFTQEAKKEREDTFRRNDTNKMQKLSDLIVHQDNSQAFNSKKSMEIINYYNRSIASEISQENSKENKMLKDALYATIKLVLDQNKQIKKLKEAVTSRRQDFRKNTPELSTISCHEETITPDLSFLSMGKDGQNPITTVNNFIKEHMPTNKSGDKKNVSQNKSEYEGNKQEQKSTLEKDQSKASQNEADSINEVSQGLITTLYL